MNFSVTISVVVIIVGLTIIALIVARARSRPNAVNVIDHDGRAEWAEDDSVAVVVERDADLQWPKMLAQSSGPLDDDTRLRLIKDLALVRAPWCVAILQQAYEEESEPTLRIAAREALKVCGDAIEPNHLTSFG